jgi:hypothetical protein
MRTVIALALLAAAPAQAHSWYSELKDSDGASCCSTRDCQPVGDCTTPSVREGVVIDGKCFAIPYAKVLPLPSPDGHTHACFMRHHTLGGEMNPIFRCIIRAGEV